MIAVFLGAGFSWLGGVPLARNIFDYKPVVDRITRHRLVERVVSGWNTWHASTGGAPEEYLAFLQLHGGRSWLDAVWFVGLVIALEMGQVERVGMKPTITRHNVDRTSGVAEHEQFWTVLFKTGRSTAVVTTNYDILIERGLRHKPRPRVPRPGFNYGFGPENLAGGGYPSYAHIVKVRAEGSVPIFKLHGSISWSVRKGSFVRYHDCRPAIRGDAAIVAPVVEKSLPPLFEPLWTGARHALQSSPIWLIVGYSLPEYDRLVLDLLRTSIAHRPEIHVFDPNSAIPSHYERLLDQPVVGHAGLPSGLSDLDSILSRGDA